MFQVYDPERMLVRWAVFDEIRLAQCKAMAQQREPRRSPQGLPQVFLSILGPSGGTATLTRRTA